MHTEKVFDSDVHIGTSINLKLGNQKKICFTFWGRKKIL